MNDRKKEETEGVSPVIGVVLMVSIVIILSALVFTDIIAFTDNSGQPPAASFNYELLTPDDPSNPSDEVRVKITVSSIDRLDDAMVSVNGVETNLQFSSSDEKIEVGDSVVIAPSSMSEIDSLERGDSIRVVGVYNTRSGVISEYVIG